VTSAANNTSMGAGSSGARRSVTVSMGEVLDEEASPKYTFHA
jgi:hypothetical protein